MNAKKRLVLTGGGTAGHVIPHLALLSGLRQHWDILYLGSSGIEKTLMEAEGVAFKTIATGKLRRYFSWQNFSDCFRIILGCWQAFWYLRAFKPQLVFSKGGFVSVPVACSAWLLRIPVITHEADYSVGLANKIIMLFAREILYTFPQTQKFLRAGSKSQLTGLPIRREVLQGDPEQGKRLCKFPQLLSKPVLLIMGGSLGAQRINQAVATILRRLLEDFYVVHLTGFGKESAAQHPHYAAFAFLNEELPHILALADLVISRAGANAIFELLSLPRPMLLIPLSQGSRGDQLHNARYFVEQGWAHLLPEEGLDGQKLLAALTRLQASSAAIIAQQASFKAADARERVLAVIAAYGEKY